MVKDDCRGRLLGVELVFLVEGEADLRGGRASAELPPFGPHQVLKGDAADVFSFADKGNFAIFERAGVFIGHNDGTHHLRHSDNKWISTIDAFQRLGRVMMGGHKLSDNALHVRGLFDKKVRLTLGPLVAIIVGTDFV